MAIRLLESRFEGLTVTDENEPGNGGPVYKSKVNIASPTTFRKTEILICS